MNMEKLVYVVTNNVAADLEGGGTKPVAVFDNKDSALIYCAEHNSVLSLLGLDSWTHWYAVEECPMNPRETK